MRGPIAHVVIWPNCSGYCGIPPDSAFRTKPRSIGSWQLTAASLPMNFPKQLPYPELFPLPRFSPHPKIGLSGHNEDPALLLQLGQFKGHSSSRDSHEIDWRFYYNYITVHHLTSSSAQFSSLIPVLHAPQVLIPKSINILNANLRLSKQRQKQKQYKTTETPESHVLFSRVPDVYIPHGPWYPTFSYALLVSIWVVSVSLVNWLSWFLSSLVINQLLCLQGEDSDTNPGPQGPGLIS